MDSLSEVPIHHVSAFDVGDAFDDGESNDVAYHFSPEAIREELARSLPFMEKWADPEVPPNGPFAAENSSVSTLDINGDGRRGSQSHSSTADSQEEFDGRFSEISLSPPQNIHDEASQRLSEDSNGDDCRDSVCPNTPADVLPEKSPLSIDSTSSDPASRNGHPGQTPSASPSSLEHPPDSGKSTQSLPNPTQTLNLARSRSLSTAVTPTATYSSPPPFSGSASPPSTSILLTEKPMGRRSNGSTGPSMLERVRSQTRPSFLPPKSRQEDDRHLADWQAMMKLSRNAAEKKRKALQERRLERERRVEDSLLIWEKEIVPNWRIVHKNPYLRKLWWSGIPTKLRASMWERAVGNSLALSKENYRTCLSRAKRALHSGTFPHSSLSLIEEDISTTLPSLRIFHHENGPLHEELKDMLCAWVVARSDEKLGYTPGAAKIAAMLLINMPVQQGFVVMRNLLERHCMRSFFGGEGSRNDVEAYHRIFDTLLADGMPKIYFNFKQHHISPSAYLDDWILPLFLNHLPFEACARIWDVLLLEGDSFLYRTALAILTILEPRLFFPDRRELLELLRGENKAAIDVARREGRPLDGGKYEIYGVDEETLWERIDEMEDWWKESTWQRLLRRELPDL